MEKKYMYTLMPNKAQVICIILVMITGDICAQFNMGEFLSRASSDLEIQIIRAQQQYMQDANFKSPFLREVELRVRARDMQSGVNDYRFRVAPLNPYERRANKDHAALMATQMETESLVAFSNVLNRRYKLLISYYYLSKLQEIELQETARYTQLMRANSRRQQAGEELIELDHRLLINELQREDIQADLNQLRYLINLDYSYDGTIDFTNFQLVSVSRIENDLSGNLDLNGQNIFVLNEENKARLSESDWEINRQESFSNIGYLQAEYRAYRGETFNENFGIQLAFQLPIVNPDRPDLARRKIDVIEDQFEVKEVAREVDMKLFNYENDLTTLIAQYYRIDKKLASFDQLKVAGFGNVGALLEMENYKHDMIRKQLELYQNILTLYIDWLQYKGLLTAEPFVNYISESRELLPE